MKKKGTLYLVQMALFVAIILLMAFTPIGYIKTLGVEITLIVIPVAVGAVIMGPAAGAALGAVFGITSFIQCFGMSAFGATLLAINPFFTFLVCVPTRILAGWAAGAAYRGLKKQENTKKIACYVANFLCPFCNTVLFTATLCLCFYRTEYIQNIAASLGSSNVLLFVVAFVGLNGLIEAVCCFVIGSLISRTLIRIL